MKMYIAVLDEFPDYMTPILVAHAVLGYNNQIQIGFNDGVVDYNYITLYNRWMLHSFKKVVLRVNQKEFDKISILPNVGLFHENNTLGGKKACAVLVVDKDIPNVLKYTELWEPKQTEKIWLGTKASDGRTLLEHTVNVKKVLDKVPTNVFMEKQC